MSITNPFTIKNKLKTLFNLLGINVQLLTAQTVKNDYGEDVEDSFSEEVIKVLPYSQAVEDAFYQPTANLNIGDVLFAVEHDVVVSEGKIIVYNDNYYKIVEVTRYTWGDEVMKSVRGKIVESPLPPYGSSEYSS